MRVSSKCSQVICEPEDPARRYLLVNLRCFVIGSDISICMDECVGAKVKDMKGSKHNEVIR